MNTAHMYLAIRRKKENEGMPTKCIRVLGHRGEHDALTVLRGKLASRPGVWRLYRSVNKRSLIKAQKLLICELILNPDKHLDDIASLWHSLLMQPKCKAEKSWLIDIDSKDDGLARSVRAFVLSYGCKIDREVGGPTPNGVHLVIDRGFDTREFKFENVEIKKDALVYIGRP